jgi:hypothetical protein
LIIPVIQFLGPKTHRRQTSDAAIPKARNSSQIIIKNPIIYIFVAESILSIFLLPDSSSAIRATATTSDRKPNRPDRNPNSNSKIRFIIPINHPEKDMDKFILSKVYPIILRCQYAAEGEGNNGASPSYASYVAKSYEGQASYGGQFVFSHPVFGWQRTAFSG